MNFLNGWRTILGGVVLICGAVYTGFGEPHDIVKAIALFGSGMAAIGLGGKAEKIIAAVKDSGLVKTDDK